MATGEGDAKFRDPPPVWDGVDPANRWRQVRRRIVLWAEDTDLHKKRQGLRVFRHLSGDAATLAESLTDEQLTAENGLQTVLNLFDEVYKGYMAIAYDRDFQDALYGGARKAGESMIGYCQRKHLELKRYEGRNEVLPDILKGKVVLRHARLDEKQLARVLTWLNGDRSLKETMACVSRLETDAEHLLVQGDHTSKSLYAESEDQYLAEEWPDYGEDENEDYLSEQYDEGADSEDEEVYWIDPYWLQEPWEERDLDDVLATFAQVQRQKLLHRKNRGFTSLTETAKGKGK
eukprot:6009335-Amphidinium_carterae.1